MPRINDNYLKLTAGYLFPEISRRMSEFERDNPDADIIKLGIGDVTEPLPEASIVAMHKAVDEMADRSTFRGYGPEQGYAWLREAVAKHDFQRHGCDIAADEVFISDGSKCDIGNILDILGSDNTVAITDPVYPAYVDTNVMAGHTGPPTGTGRYEGLIYLPATEENNFAPDLPTQKVDVIYLCYPNNPTGVVASKQTLKKWVDFARENDALILFDAAYEAFITDPEIPHSIFEIEGARECAIEFRSLSKNAGFTGVRCGMTIVPKGVAGKSRDGSDVELHPLWLRRQSTKFNGVSYIVQRGAEAIYSANGQEQMNDRINYYLENARIIRETLPENGMAVFGGINAPYVWVKAPEGMTSWDLFDRLLQDAHVVGTPGSGFGEAGEGYFRISAFNSRANVNEAMDRIGAKLVV